MQLSLYRAERPEVFEDIIGQKQIVRILQNQIKNNSVSQAYLFTGTHGTGKTSTARILAKAVNCECTDGPIPCGECENCRAIKEGRYIDVIELDAASNNKVEDLRALIDLVKYPPTLGRYKVYIIDEVHMLTVQAENAFLKTLEEPPEYAIFILATTDPQKVKDTIKSRCMQLNFKRVNEEDLIDGMARICERNGVEVTHDALGAIASQANGSVRDALSILEQCMAAGDTYIDRKLVLEYTGAAGEEFFLELTDSVFGAQVGNALTLIDEAMSQGKDAKQLLKDWLEHYRNLLVCRFVERAEKIVNASSENIDRIRAQAVALDTKDIEKAIRLLSEYINLGRYSDKPRILVETAVVRLAGETSGVPLEPVAAPARPLNFTSTPRVAEPTAPAGAVESAAGEKPAVQRTSSVKQETVRTAPAEARYVEHVASHSQPATHNPSDMWRNIVSAISRFDRSFETLVGKNSRADSYNNDELLVTVRKNKLHFAEELSSEIERTAKNLYGANVYVTFRAGDVTGVERAIRQPERSVAPQEPVVPDNAFAPEELASLEVNMVEEDMLLDEIVSDIESVLGVSNIDIID